MIYKPWPKRSSTLSPKIHKYSIFPPRCSHPACMNMDVKIVRDSPKGSARKRDGTKAQRSIKASPPLSSSKKTMAFNAIRIRVTTGTVLRALSSSPIGNMDLLLLLNGNAIYLINNNYVDNLNQCK